MLRGQNILRAMLSRGVAVRAMATGGQTWTQEAPKEADSGVLEEVLVTARRAAIESAQMRKRNAEIIAVVVADAGKLPDNSITEGGNLANKIVKTSMGGYPNDRKYIRGWSVADHHVNASPRLSF
jgi:hypothetical protein